MVKPTWERCNVDTKAGEQECHTKEDGSFKYRGGASESETPGTMMKQAWSETVYSRDRQ